MRKVYCATLGCDKNLVDSEALLGRFALRGVVAVSDPAEADVWVLNTCGFIEAARIDSEETLVSLIEAKQDRTLVVCGCWSQEHADLIRRRYPEVDLVAGVGQFDQVVAAVTGMAGAPAGGLAARVFPLVSGPPRRDTASASAASPAPLVGDPMAAAYVGMEGRLLLTPPHIAFVKVAEGCDFNCSFCRIPLIRGKQRSRPVQEIEREVRGLAERGVTEIQVVSQNTGDFGRDLGLTLHDLVSRLSLVDGLRRIRLFYLYPGVVTADDLLRLLDLPKVVPYLDLPVQHASARILRAMRRPGAERTSADFFGALRRRRPDLVLRTTVMLGFPGEEDEDVERLADFLAEVGFDHLGTYRYSPEAGTSAARLADQVPAEVVLDREALIGQVQEEIALARQRSRLGETFEVVVDAVVDPATDPAGFADSGLQEVLAGLGAGEPRDPGAQRDLAGRLCGESALACGRSYHFAYDIDGVVLMPAGNLRPGQWVQAEFMAVTAYDAWAQPAAGAAGKGRSG